MSMFSACAKKSDGNILISPHVLGKVIGMVGAGTNGETKRQIGQVLNDPSGVNAASIGEYEASLAVPNAPYEISTATSLYVQDGFPARQAFVDDLARGFGAKHHPGRHFATDSEGEIALINQDVANATHGMIKELFPAGSLDGSTVIALTAALYAKFSWATKFDEALTRNGPFTLMGGGTKPTALMHRESIDPKTGGEYLTPYFENNTVQVLELPFAGEKFSAVIVLPKEKGEAALRNLETNLDESALKEWFSGLATDLQNGGSEVNITLPRLDLNDGGERDEILKDLGITDVYQPGVADLTGIHEVYGRGRLYLQTVVDANVLKLNEHGVVMAAAAGAGVAMESLPPPPKDFVANRPFLFFVRDTQSGVILMMGRVADPGDADPLLSTTSAQSDSEASNSPGGHEKLE
jgi:serpin B